MRLKVKVFFSDIISRSIALTLIVFLLPLLFLIAILIMMTSDGNIIHRSIITGKDGNKHRVLKFTTTYTTYHPLYISKASLNFILTPTGRILRKYRLNELPVLFNVLSGKVTIFDLYSRFAFSAAQQSPIFRSNGEELVPFILLFIRRFFLRITVEETFVPLIADWQQEEYEAQQGNNIWWVRWLFFYYIYALLKVAVINKVSEIMHTYRFSRKD